MDLLAEAPAAATGTGRPREVLARTFGFPAFRGLQERVVAHVTGGGDALVLMPTGGGKSVCYQVPALVRPGMAIVVSPLIALMDDQVAGLRQLGVAAGALHSDLDPDEQRRIGRALDAGALDLIYVSPERLLSSGTLERLQRQEICLLAIDEAHCVSQWGHEFRPEYRELASLARHFPGVPRVALTATADPRTRADILHALDMEGAEVFVASFHRPNLTIAAAGKSGETAQLLDLLSRHPGEAGIVYCGSRNKTERIAASLRAKGFAAVAFHAGLPAEEKRAAAARFRSGEAVVVVATIAFGMGIDRPDVRFVAHLDMPDSPEAYYQQIGRAGRDGDPSETLLLYGGEDIARARYFLQGSAAPEAQKRVMRERLESMIALTETPECRTRALLACFGEEMGAACGHCDNCLSPAQVFDGTTEAQKVLSAVYRTGQRFGAVHVVAVLTGKATDTVVQWSHDTLPVFGIGRDRPEAFWRGVIRQLIARGALQVESGTFATLRLGAEVARPILRGEVAVMLRAEADRPRERRGARRDGSTASAATAGDPGLFEALRQWRAGEAKAQSLPPYVIFHDAVLREIAAIRPDGLDALAEVKGVGASKLARYGAAVLAVLRKAG
ncbi:MAG: DNA helicase RecQ [Rhodospirillales bacterium]|nr:DNA helicase RecQ [Rhodospirillales bacterium]